MKSSKCLLVIAIMAAWFSIPMVHATEKPKASTKSEKQDKSAGAKSNQKNIEAATSLFEGYKAHYLKYNFDGCDKYYIDNPRVHISVGGRTKAVDGKTWKSLSRKTLNQMKSAGIKSSFGKPRFSAKGKYVRVRFNVRTLTEVDTIDWLLKENAGGTLKIVEERQHARITR